MAAFISSQKTEYGIDHVTSCRASEVSQSWFYKWKNRIGQDAPTARERRRASLDAEITRSFEASGGTYGSASEGSREARGIASDSSDTARCGTYPEVFPTRAEAERALWRMIGTGQADCTHDRRYRAFVLLATLASLRWGEITALTRADLDLDAGIVRGAWLMWNALLANWFLACPSPRRAGASWASLK